MVVSSTSDLTLDSSGIEGACSEVGRLLVRVDSMTIVVEGIFEAASSVLMCLLAVFGMAIRSGAHIRFYIGFGRITSG